jgi:hypothetical protein
MAFSCLFHNLLGSWPRERRASHLGDRDHQEYKASLDDPPAKGISTQALKTLKLNSYEDLV